MFHISEGFFSNRRREEAVGSPEETSPPFVRDETCLEDGVNGYPLAETAPRDARVGQSVT